MRWRAALAAVAVAGIVTGGILGASAPAFGNPLEGSETEEFFRDLRQQEERQRREAAEHAALMWAHAEELKRRAQAAGPIVPQEWRERAREGSRRYQERSDLWRERMREGADRRIRRTRAGGDEAQGARR